MRYIVLVILCRFVIMTKIILHTRYIAYSAMIVIITLLSSLSLAAQLIGDYTHPGSLMLGGVHATMQGADALYGNTAGLADEDSFLAGAGITRNFGIEGFEKINIGIGTPLLAGIVGVNVQHRGVGDLSSSIIGMYYARKLANILAISGQVDYITDQIAQFGSLTGFGFRLGVQSQISKHWALGGYLVVPPTAAEQTLSSVGLIDVGLRYTPTDAVAIHAAIQNIERYGEGIAAGVDYRLNPTLQVRAGIQTARSAFNTGVRLHVFDKVQIDLAAAYTGDLGLTPGIGLSYVP